MPNTVMPELLKDELEDWEREVKNINQKTVRMLKDKLLGKKLHVVRRDLGVPTKKEVKGVLTDIERYAMHPNGLPEFLFVFDEHDRWWVNQFTEIKIIG
jgi:hypothetical protein